MASALAKMNEVTFMNVTEPTTAGRIVSNIVTIYGAFLILGGTLGNIGVAIIILNDKGRIKLTTRVLFTMMTTADCLVIWIAVSRYWIRVTWGIDVRSRYAQLCPFHVFAVYISTNLAMLILCILCLDRCIIISNSVRSLNDSLVTLAKCKKMCHETLVDGVIRKMSDEEIKKESTICHCFNVLSKVIDRFSNRYVLKPTRYIIFAFITGLLIIFAKHSFVFYEAVVVPETNECLTINGAIIRDYIDFATQAILVYIIIIPTNIIVYRSIRRHQITLNTLKMSRSRGRLMSDRTNNSQKMIGSGRISKNSIRSGFGSLRDHKDSIINSQSTVNYGPSFSNGNLYVFKTLICLSVLNFVISFPGYLYALIIHPVISEKYQRISIPIYDALFMLAFTNNGANFYVLMCTVKGFRRRFFRSFKACWMFKLCFVKSKTNGDNQRSIRTTDL